MNWIYAIIGSFGIGSVTLIVWWLVRIGKTIAKNEELARRLTAGDIIARKKNRFIKEVDALAAKSRGLDEELRKEFNRGPSAANVMRVLSDAADDTTPKGPKDAA